MKPFIAKLFSMNLSFFILLSYLTFNSQAFSEETRYIRDTLFVPLRSGQSFKHRIVHKGLVSGTPLTIIGLNEDETYSHVRTRQGIEGWIQTQYLSNEPSARNQLASITAQNTQLKAQKSTLAQEFSALKKQHDDAQAQIKKLTQINLKRQKELSDIKDISANAITLNNDNKVLLQQTQELQNKADLLQTDNQRLNDSLENDEFMSGAFAVLIGVFITLIVPRLWPSKSSEWA